MDTFGRGRGSEDDSDGIDGKYLYKGTRKCYGPFAGEGDDLMAEGFVKVTG